MKPLREDPTGAEGLGPLLEAARQVPDWPARGQDDLWRRLQREANSRAARTLPRSAIAFPAVAALALAVLLLPRLLPARTPVPAREQSAVIPLADARFTGSGAARVLVAGTVRAAPGAQVHTPQLEVQVESARCLVRVAGEVTWVDVEEGQVRVRRGDGPELILSSGTRLRSDDPRLVRPLDLPAATPTPAPPDACAPLPAPGSRRACYAHAAMGSGLSAQNALYALGQLDREARDLGSAVQYFRAYQQRYPDGALWPEAATGILTARLEQHAWPEALQAAEQYLAREPHGPRAPEVGLIRANLLREHAGRVRAALQAYQALTAQTVPPPVRSEALFGEALAASRLGLQEVSREALHVAIDGGHCATSA